MTAVPLDTRTRPTRTRRPGHGARPTNNLTRGAGLALGISVTWFSILVDARAPHDSGH